MRLTLVSGCSAGACLDSVQQGDNANKEDVDCSARFNDRGSRGCREGGDGEVGDDAYKEEDNCNERFNDHGSRGCRGGGGGRELYGAASNEATSRRLLLTCRERDVGSGALQLTVTV
jgi:hypothetical protein